VILIAGVVTVPVNVGEAKGALSAKASKTASSEGALFVTPFVIFCDINAIVPVSIGSVNVGVPATAGVTIVAVPEVAPVTPIELPVPAPVKVNEVPVAAPIFGVTKVGDVFITNVVPVPV
jgi:hypothetical protein